MMLKEYWDEIEGIGKMYMENELVVGVETVFFVCINDEGRWLFMTYDSAEGDYVFCKIRENTLVQMLNNEITMEEAYRKAKYIGETFIDEEGKMRFNRYETGSFSGERLPDKGAYYDIKSEYINQYICELQRYCESRYEVIDYSYGENSLGDISLNITSAVLDEVVMNWYTSSFSCGDYPTANYIGTDYMAAENTVEELCKIKMPIEVDVVKENGYFNDTVNMAA